MVFASCFRRRALALALVTGTMGLTPARSVAPSPAASARVQKIAISGFAFAPQVITVTPGTTVIWTNADEDSHTVTANDKSFHSTATDTNEHFEFTFTHAGEFAYFCSLHPHMTGKVIVKG